MAPTPTGTSSSVRLEWVPGALAQCRNSGDSMALVASLGAKFLAKANSRGQGYKLGLHMVARKYIANVYCGSAASRADNARNQTLAKLLSS